MESAFNAAFKTVNDRQDRTDLSVIDLRKSVKEDIGTVHSRINKILYTVILAALTSIATLGAVIYGQVVN